MLVKIFNNESHLKKKKKEKMSKKIKTVKKIVVNTAQLYNIFSKNI